MNVQNRAEIVNFISKIVEMLSVEERETLLNKFSEKENELPISIFKNKELSGLEVIVYYLKTVKKMSAKEIAESLNRKLSTIYTTFNNAKSKIKGDLDVSDLSITIPIEVFSDRKYAVLESLVFHLKDAHMFNLTQVAELLGKNYNTIKTVYRRYQLKRK